MAAQIPFGLEHTAHHGYDVVVVRGALDIHTAPRLRRLGRDVSRMRQPLLVLDLTELEFLDSSGIGALVGTRRDATERQVVLALVVPPSFTGLRRLQMMQLDVFFNIHPTLESAVDAHAP